MPTLPEVHRRGTRATQPAASTVSVGAYYYVTDEGRSERSNGTAWESVTDTAASTFELQQQIDDLRVRLVYLERGRKPDA
jgi:hypothetical protein